jgi:hypothetical protein
LAPDCNEQTGVFVLLFCFLERVIQATAASPWQAGQKQIKILKKILKIN